jgi:hypothetical protein
MRTIGQWVLAPGEFKRFGVDYSNWLNGSETIGYASCVVTPRTAPVFEVSGVVITDNGAGVVFFAGKGVAGEEYTVAVTITTSIGQTKQDIVLYRVRDN